MSAFGFAATTTRFRSAEGAATPYYGFPNAFTLSEGSR